MSYPTYLQGFEGGTTLATAAPELVDFDSAYAIDSSGSQAFTGTHSLKLTGVSTNHSILSNVADTLAGDLTFSAYIKNLSTNASLNLQIQSVPVGTGGTSFQRFAFGPTTGIELLQDNAGVTSVLNTTISGVTMLTGIFQCLEIRCHGTTISARVVRQDNGQFFVNTGSGSWSNTPQVQSGTATLAKVAGSWGLRLGDNLGVYVDDLVIEPSVPVIDIASFTLSSVGATQQLTAGGFTDPITGVTWSSSNTGVATVDSSGLVTAVAAGSATITATGKRDTGQTATSAATVTPMAANGYTVTSPTPASGFATNASGNYTITPNGTYSSTITASISGGGLSTSITKTWSGTPTPQTFNFTPTAIGTVTVTFSNGGTLADHAPVNYLSLAQTLTLSPQGMQPLTIQSIAMIGGGTHWLSTPPAPSHAGLAGFGFGSVVVATDTAATATAISTAATGTETITDTVTGATATLTVTNNYGYLSTVSGFVPGQLAGYTIYPTGSNIPISDRSADGVVEIGGGAYKALVFLPFGLPVEIRWDDSQGHYASENVNPNLYVANTLSAAGGKLFGTGTVGAVTTNGHFDVTFDIGYSGNLASLTDGTLYLSFTSGLNQWHSKAISGGTLANSTSANLTFTSPFSQTVASGDTFAIVSN